MKYQKGEFITVPNRSHLSSVSIGAQCLFMWLCAYTDEDGICFPSRSTLASKMGAGISTVDNYLKELVAAGLVTKENRFRDNEKMTNEYQVVILPSPKSGVPTPKAGQPLPQNLGIELNPILTQSTQEAISSEIAPLAVSNSKDHEGYTKVSINEEGDERVPRQRKPRETWAAERAVFDIFAAKAKKELGVTPPSPEVWQLKKIREALAKNKIDVNDLLDDWFLSGRDADMLAIHKVFSAANLSRYLMTNV